MVFFFKNVNYFFTKMENKKTSLSEISGLKVSELKSLAKQFGLNRYSKLRKQELIKIVEERKIELIRESD